MRKDGIVLTGRPGAVLDGSALTGTRHGVRIESGVRDVTIQGFEIRFYDDLLALNDASSGIVGFGGSTNVTIRNNHIHHNAWAGVVFAGGTNSGWKVLNNTFESHGFTHVLAQHTRFAEIAGNTMRSVDHGIVLAASKHARISKNTMSGPGIGGIVVTPAFGRHTWSQDVLVEGNTVTGRWTHGLWALGLSSSTIQGNDLRVEGTGMTLGGNPEDVRLLQNVVGSIHETGAVKVAKQAFREGSPRTGIQSTEHAPVDSTCSWFGCILQFLKSILDFLFPSAAAQTAGGIPLSCELPACGPSDIEALFQYALLTGLNPLAAGENAADLARLSGCEGQPDVCLRSAFIDPSDPNPPHAWSITVQDAVLGSIEARFIDVGIRQTTQNAGRRYIEASLDREWTPFVLCRLYIDDVPTRCDVLPRLFDFGLAVTHAPTQEARHVSNWRLMQPTSGVHASFDRIHSEDATMFKSTTKPHHASSPQPSDALLDIAPVVADPLRVSYAGTAVLRCVISARAPPEGVMLARDDCGDPTLVRQPSSLTVEWCSGEKSEHDEGAHGRVAFEAVEGWAWATSCAPVGQAPRLNWTTVFNKADLAALADAQGDYYTASSDAARTEAMDRAEGVFVEAITRHLALRDPGSGMPSAVSAALFQSTLPTVLGAALPEPLTGLSALRVAGETFVVGGRGSTDVATPRILTFDPVAGTSERQPMRAGWFPRYFLASHAGAYYDGKILRLIGGYVSNPGTYMASDYAQRYNPQTNAALDATSSLPRQLAGFGMVWDPTSRSFCTTGCAYGFGGVETRHVYDPVDRVWGWKTYYRSEVLSFRDGQGSTVASLASPRANTSVISTGTHAYVFGGHDGTRHLDDIIRFDLATRQVQVMSAKLPGGRSETAAVWDGRYAYIFGGTNGTLLSEVIRYDPATDAVIKKQLPLPTPTASAAAVYDGKNAYLFGGRTPTGPVDDIVRYNPATREATILADIAKAGSDFSIVDLEAGPGSESNAFFVNAQILDEKAGWLNTTTPGLVALTPTKFTIGVRYTGLDGTKYASNVSVVVSDDLPRLMPPVTVEYGGAFIGEITAKDPDNKDHQGLYVDPTKRRLHTLPLVNVASPTGLLDRGLEHAGFSTTSGAVEACARELWTAQASGTESNAAPPTRLALAPASNLVASCTAIARLDALLLTFSPAISVSLEIRDGPDFNATYQIVDDPFKHPAQKGGWSDRSLARAIAHHVPTPREKSVQPTAVRVTLELPQRNLSALQQAAILTDLIESFSGSVGVFAVEIDDLPLTDELSQAIEEAARDEGTVVLVGAGRLPGTVADTWAVQDKLLTITGLAAHPLVITVGAATLEGGVAKWSRRGPTATFGPKPDLVAPSPAGTTGGAVANVLPLAEALLLRGVQDPHIVRSILAAFAVPVKTERNTPATFWEQGFGLLDLDIYLDMPSTPELLAMAKRPGETDARTKWRLAIALGVSNETVATSAPNTLLGLTAPATGLIRSAVAATLLNLTLDTPALPQNLIVDFGVVNNELEGRARFAPIDLDNVTKETTRALRVLLEEAGYTGTSLDQNFTRVKDKIQIRAMAGQNVTLDATHYYLYDLLKDDFLYTTYHGLLAQAAQGPLPPGADQDAVLALKNTLDDWLLNATKLTQPTKGTARLPVEVELECKEVPLTATFHLANSTLKILRRQAQNLAATLTVADRLNILVGLVNTLPTDVDELFSRSNQAYSRSQSKQLACLSDQREVIQNLTKWTNDLRQLKRLPNGAWNQTEAERGTWDKTPLGADINASLAALALPLTNLTDNSTLVLDAVLDALVRAERLLSQKLNLTRIPSVVAKPPTGPVELRTDPSKTRNATLGAYVGLATMTSHNVTVYNPFTGETVIKKDVTIPLLSILWNNPTLEWNERYRDTSPYSDALVMLTQARGGPFESFGVNYIHNQDGIKVNLTLDPARLHQPEIDIVVGEINNLTATLDDTNMTRPYGVYANKTRAFMTQYRSNLTQWKATLDCISEKVPCDYDDALNRATSHLLTALLTMKVSHLDYQAGKTDAKGNARFTHLFPGLYSLYAPYPYASRANLTQHYEYGPPLEGGFDLPVTDPTYELDKQLENRINNLSGHATGAKAPKYAPYGYSQVDNWERQNPEHQRWAPGFRGRLQGPDVLGVTCLALRDFNAKTETNFAFPGCGDDLVSNEHVDELRYMLQYARCIVGLPHEDLTTYDAENCKRMHADATKAQQDCLTGACADKERTDAFLASTRNLTLLLDNLTTPKTTLLVPFARSPGRLLNRTPAAFGYTAAEVAARSKKDNPITVLPSQIEAAATTTLKRLDDLVNKSLIVTPPPRTAYLNHTLAQSVLHHITDRVSGADWFMIDEKTPATLTNASKINDLFSRSIDLVNNQTEKDLIEAVRNSIPPVAGLTAFNDGLSATYKTVAGYYRDSGWRPNGVVAIDGMKLTGESTTGVITQAACPGVAENLTGLPRSFYNGASKPSSSPNPPDSPNAPFTCRDVFATIGPTTEDVKGVDVVQFANVILEEARAETPLPGGLYANASAMLKKAVALSSSDEKASWRRGEDGLLVDLTGAQAGELPSAGVMIYSTPVPLNEYVQFRLDGEFYMHDTGAIVIASGNPLVSEALLASMGAIGQANASFTGHERAMRAIQAAMEQTEHPEDTLLRVDIIGAPVKVEEKVKLPEQFRGIDDVSVPSRPNPLLPEITLPLHAIEDCEDFLRFCERGMAVARTGTIHNFSRTYEFNTRYRGPTKTGIETLDVFVVYFPLSASANPGGPQKFMVKDFMIQLDTFVGYGAGRRAPGEPGDASYLSRIGYRANVEDWSMLYALPDQRFDDPATPAIDGLRANFTFGGTTIQLGPSDLVRGLNQTLRGERNVTGSCPEEFAPGYPIHSLETTIRALPAPGAMFIATRGKCIENGVDALAPVHRETTTTVPMPVMSEEKKKPVDALQYVFNVVPIESFTQVGQLLLKTLVVNPLTALGVSSPATDKYTSIPKKMVAQQLSNAKATASDVVDAASVKPILDLREATPFIHPSFIKAAQGGRVMPKNVSAPVLHNYAVINVADIRPLMQDPWDWTETILVQEASLLSLANTPYTASAKDFPAQSWPFRNSTDYYGVVAAHGLDIRVTQEDPQPSSSPGGRLYVSVESSALTLVGHGITGAGLAFNITAKETGVAWDNAYPSFVRGHRFESNFTLKVQVYELGGNKTASSDCKQIPMYTYVRAYFRCAGYDAYNSTTELNFGAQPTACYDQAITALDAAFVLAVKSLANSTQDQYFLRASLEEHALQTLTNVPTPLIASAVHLVDVANTRTLTYQAGAEASAVAAQELAKCLIEKKLLDLDHRLGTDLVIPAAFGALEPARSLPDRAKEALEVTKGAQPEITQWGEPPRLLDAKLLISNGIRNAQAVPLDGPYIVGYAVDEWSSRFDRGNLTVTVRNAAGAVLSTTTTGIPAAGTYTTTPSLVNGNSYTFLLRARDGHGNTFSDQATITSDTLPPRILTTPAAIEYANADRAFTWSVQDPESGLKEARIERQGTDGTWSLWGPTFDPAFSRSRSALALERILAASTLPEGTVAVRLVAEDWAGHKVTQVHDLVVDRTAPVAAGRFTNAVNGRVTVPHLNATTQGWDNRSGLATYRVTYAGVDGALDILARDATVNAYGTGPLADTAKPLPDTRYVLRVRATDRAGNVADVALGNADVQIRPLISSTVPELLYQQTADPLTIQGATEMRDYPALAVDAARIDVFRLVDNAPSGSAIWTRNLGATVGAIGGYWVPPENDAGSFRVSYYARKGTAPAYMNATVNVTLATNAVRDLYYTTARTYGVLNATSEGDLYRLHDPWGCSNSFTVTARSLDGHDVDIHLAAGDPATLGAVNVGAYSVHRNSTATTETYKWNNTDDGATYALLVKHKNTNTRYAVDFRVSCGSGDDDLKKPELTWPY